MVRTLLLSSSEILSGQDGGMDGRLSWDCRVERLYFNVGRATGSVKNLRG